MTYISDAITLLESEWEDDNTEQITPSFQEMFDKKTRSRYQGSDHEVYLYPLNPQSSSDAGIGSTEKNVFYSFTIQIRTNKSHSFLIALRDEVQRILEANISLPLEGKYTRLEAFEDERDRSNEYKKEYVYEKDARFRDLAKRTAYNA